MPLTGNTLLIPEGGPPAAGTIPVFAGGGTYELNAQVPSSQFASVVALNAGSDTAASAPILTAVAGTSGGGGVQLTDTTRDYTVYLEVGTAGTAMSVTMGHSSAANDVTLKASGVATAGDVITFRLPAGWYFAWAATTATLAQSVAVGC